MSKSQPVFFLSNPNRKDEFLIETRIWDTGKSRYAEKRPSSKKAAAHLERMAKTYATLASVKKISTRVNIVAPKKTSKGMIFDYVEGSSAERLLLERVLLKDSQGAYDIIDKLFMLIDALPSNKQNPAQNSAYTAVFGKSFNSRVECAELGLIDLNLDNIIIDKNSKWYLYDYEWVFDFPVPKQFLKMRIIWYFITRHRDILLYHAERLECLRIGKKVFIPKFLHARYGKLFSTFHDMRIAETSFQVYATGKADKKLTSFQDTDFAAEEATAPTVGIESTFHNLVHSETKKIKDELSFKVNSERTQREALQKKLDQITSSRSYRLAQKAMKLKRKLLSIK